MKPSILFISSSPTWPLTDGKRQRTWFLMEALSEHFTIDFLFIGYEDERQLILSTEKRVRNFFFLDGEDSKFLLPGYTNLFINSVDRKRKQNYFNYCKQVLSQISYNEYKFVFSRYAFPTLSLPLPTNMKIICDIDDVYYQSQLTRIGQETKITNKIKYFIFFLIGVKNVLKAYQRINIPIIVKDSDRVYPGLKNAVCIQNLPFSFFIQQKKTFLSVCKVREVINVGFIGKLSYAPNYMGLLEFVQKIWTPLVKQGINAKLLIAGSGKLPIRLTEDPQVISSICFLGLIDDISEFWSQVDIFISPVRAGGGSNIKIAEALINGKKIVAHSFSMRGYEKFIDNCDIVVAKSVQDWKNQLTQMIIANRHDSSALKIKAMNEFDLENWKKRVIDTTNLI